MFDFALKDPTTAALCTNCEGHIPDHARQQCTNIHIIDIIIAAVSLNFLFWMDQTMQIDQIVC